MDKIDKLIRAGLLKEAERVPLETGTECLSALELSRYLGGVTDNIERLYMERHLAECPVCLDKLVSAYDGENFFKRRSIRQAVKKWLPKNMRKNKWLIASITAFVLSFAFPPVFLQFLMAAGILGGKWIFDSENAKTLVMVYNAWKKGGDKEAGEMLRSLRDRFPTKKF
ncbi:MAG: zf-HC2 domain-containing protein [Candidatus Omnitrophica bacterium]|nr:zf-HC2 domain-containing protein [Candidatus Omnitrophota bacterium]